jgi:hypothetical protein
MWGFHGGDDDNDDDDLLSFLHRVDWQTDVNVSEEHTVSIFRAEVAMPVSGGARFESEKGNVNWPLTFHFWTYIIPPFPGIATSALKIETVCSNETLSSTC